MYYFPQTWVLFLLVWTDLYSAKYKRRVLFRSLEFSFFAALFSLLVCPGNFGLPYSAALDSSLSSILTQEVHWAMNGFLPFVPWTGNCLKVVSWDNYRLHQDCYSQRSWLWCLMLKISVLHILHLLLVDLGGKINSAPVFLSWPNVEAEEIEVSLSVSLCLSPFYFCIVLSYVYIHTQIYKMYMYTMYIRYISRCTHTKVPV